MLCHSNPYLLTLVQKQKLWTANCIRNILFYWLPFHFSYFSTQVRILLFLGFWSLAQRATTMARSGCTHGSSCRWPRCGSAKCQCPHSLLTWPRSNYFSMRPRESITIKSWNVYVEILNMKLSLKGRLPNITQNFTITEKDPSRFFVSSSISYSKFQHRHFRILLRSNCKIRTPRLRGHVSEECGHWHLADPHLQLEPCVRQRAARPRHGGRPLGRGPVAQEEKNLHLRREIWEMKWKPREKVCCVAYAVCSS